MTVRIERNGSRRFRAAALAGTAALALVLSACGSDNNAGSGTTSAPTSAPTSESPAATSESPAATSESPAATGSGAPPAVEMTGDKAAVKVGMAYDVGGRGDQSFNDSAARGLDKAKAAGVTIVNEIEATATDTDAQREDRLRQLAEGGANVVIAVGFAYEPALAKAAPDYPDVHFAIIDDATLCDPAAKGGPVKNVACLTFAEEQGSYLVGVAAALKSKTGKIGFVGGVNTPLIQKFQAGFEAGVKATKADDTVTPKYITEPPDFSGFNDPGKGETIAKGMYDGGSDIVYAAAGGSGAGVFKAAKAAKGWGIGVDSDQYNAPTLSAVKDVILTSMVKNVDVAVWDDIAGAVNGKPLTGQHVYDLKVGGVGYATSGGFVDDIVPQLEAAKAKIISGEIKVPSTVG
ncbi:BMP family lipoprotein [Nakamurella lactea]|uniref:BMP family lipoprotein n=1 Tax=Nakamurella lactea TaxID=459515 RepID=UPI00040739CA|nr:BMP family ABC transporter substrate-binding protein [Nakamurella lactea]